MATAQSGTRTTGRTSWVGRTVITVVSLVAFAIALLMSIRMFGGVQGIEFSPDTLRSRTFVYYEIPLIRVRVTGVYRHDISGGLQQRISSPQFSPAATVDPPRWDLVVMTRGGNFYQDDALIVFRYFQDYSGPLVNAPAMAFSESAAAKFWSDWTNRHGALAKILCPAVVECCRRDLYTFTPALFTAAEQITAGGRLPRSPTSTHGIVHSRRWREELRFVRRGISRPLTDR